MSTRLDFVLGLVLMLSGLGIVNSQYQSRRLFINLETAASQARKLNTERVQLRLDQLALCNKSRIEKNARKKLHMVIPTAAHVQYLIIDER